VERCTGRDAGCGGLIFVLLTQPGQYFPQWTIEVLGRPLFQKLLLGFMDRPAEAEQVFRDVYGEDLSIAVFQFDATVRAGGWTPTGVEVTQPSVQ